MGKNKLIVYGSEHCFKCKQLVSELKAKGTEFKYIDINTLASDEVDRLIEKHGTSLPIKVEVKK